MSKGRHFSYIDYVNCITCFILVGYLGMGRHNEASIYAHMANPIREHDNMRRCTRALKCAHMIYMIMKHKMSRHVGHENYMSFQN